MKTIEFDIRGQICPSTLLVALKEMNGRRAGLQGGTETLCFLTDNRDCLVTIPEAAKNMGYEAVVGKSGDHYRIDVRRKGPAGE